MLASRLADMSAAVALRKESVDRNGLEINGVSYDVWVALRKESVDRNKFVNLRVLDGSKVALRKESVDRNSCWLLA